MKRRRYHTIRAGTLAAATLAAVCAGSALAPVQGAEFSGPLEYFIDTDPGPGMGMEVAAVDGVATFTVPVAGLQEGTHTLFIRARGPDGVWGLPFPYSFAREISAAYTATADGEVESFFDWDPGAGAGTVVAASGGQAAFNAATTQLQPGTHTLYLRTRPEGGSWGPGFPFTFAMLPAGHAGHPARAGRLLAYLERAGVPIPASRVELPLDNRSAPFTRSLTIPLDALTPGNVTVAACILSESGQPGWIIPATVTIVESGTNGFATWGTATAFFSPEELANPFVSGPLADPDQDGLPNAAEFAFGSHPRKQSRDRIPWARMAGDELLFTFYQLRGGSGNRGHGYVAGGIAYFVDWCHDPAGSLWSSGADDTFSIHSIQDNGDGTDTVVIAVDRAVIDAHPATFLRVRLALL